MPRPTKCRRVCHYPQTAEFRPTGMDSDLPPVILNVDEYEAIRLIDREGLSQEQCSERMQVARTTVQRVYESARQKIASALVEGRTLRIEGGDYRLCDGRGCPQERCVMQQIQKQYTTSKGDPIMRIAVTYENGQVFQHFGHTKQFKVYDIQNGQVVDSKVLDTNGSGHGALAGLLQTRASAAAHRWRSTQPASRFAAASRAKPMKPLPSTLPASWITAQKPTATTTTMSMATTAMTTIAASTTAIATNPQ